MACLSKAKGAGQRRRRPWGGEKTDNKKAREGRNRRTLASMTENYPKTATSAKSKMCEMIETITQQQNSSPTNVLIFFSFTVLSGCYC